MYYVLETIKYLYSTLPFLALLLGPVLHMGAESPHQIHQPPPCTSTHTSLADGHITVFPHVPRGAGVAPHAGLAIRVPGKYLWSPTA